MLLIIFIAKPLLCHSPQCYHCLFFHQLSFSAIMYHEITFNNELITSSKIDQYCKLNVQGEENRGQENNSQRKHAFLGSFYCWSTTTVYAQMTLGDESLGKFAQSFQRQVVNKNVTCLLRVEFLKCYSVFCLFLI